MALLAFSQVDMFAKVAALVTFLLLVWAVARFRWFASEADKAEESGLGTVMLAVSAAVIAIVIVAAVLGPHPA